MMIGTVQAIANRVVPKGQDRHTVADLRFDWAIVLLTGGWVGGLYLDGWAHRHGKVDQSFFTPWHAVFYAGYLVTALLIVMAAYRNVRGGRRGWDVLPASYELSALGLVLFGLAGIGDLIWHTLFGIEVDTEALLSPTHLLLAMGLVLAISGPLRAGWRRVVPAEHWWALFPMVMALAFLLSVFTFMTQFAHPLVSTWAAIQPGYSTTSQLYVMNADGTNQTRLSNDAHVQYWHPAFSPDGRRIAYAAGQPETLQIFVANRDGSDPRQLTNDGGHDIAPTWSPDGTRLLYASARGGGFQLYVVSVDGTSEPRLLEAASDLYAAWSPDGHQIVFTGIRDGDWQVYVMGADGSNAVRLTDRGGNYFPQWSPDGSRILFTSARDGRNQLYVMNADGSHQTRLTDNTSDDRFGHWSPDGSKITFASRREGNFEIYLMNADGTGQTNLTNNPGTESSGVESWSPDGSKIIFSAESHPALQQFLTEELGIASILLQAGVLAGVVLLALRRRSLPLGSLTLVFTLNAVLMSFLNDRFEFIPAAIGAGIISDLVLARLKPSPTRPGSFHLAGFAVPAIYFAFYFLALLMTKGIAWSIHLWMGSIVLAGIVGLVLSYLAVSPPAPAAQTTA